MQQVIICVGISGAGKSTFTSFYTQKNKMAIRINRDSIREMLIPNGSRDPQYYKRSDLFNLESMVSVIEDVSFETALKQGRSIIVDNTNLSQKYIAHWLFEAGEAEIKFKLFDCDPSLAKERVFWRDFKTVASGSHLPITDEKVAYIDKQALQYEEVKKWLLKEHKDKII
jgi:predicted kinase